MDPAKRLRTSHDQAVMGVAFGFGGGALFLAVGVIAIPTGAWGLWLPSVGFGVAFLVWGGWSWHRADTAFARVTAPTRVQP
jgi:hypothetical protein